jgi:hypothetical protein
VFRVASSRICIHIHAYIHTYTPPECNGKGGFVGVFRVASSRTYIHTHTHTYTPAECNGKGGFLGVFQVATEQCVSFAVR